MPAESPATSTDLVFLGFLGGFALATLIFWPLLHRARTRLGRAAAAPTGKHAKRSDRKPALPAAPRPTASTDQQASTPAKAGPGKAAATAVIVPAAAGTTAVTTGPAESGDSGDGAAASSSTSAEGAADGADTPAIKDVFEEHYGPKFDLVRDRLANLREQINGEC